MPETPVHVWFNKSFAVTASFIQALEGSHYVAHASHTDATHLSLHAAPHAFLKPRALVGEEYVAWALQTARQRGIQILVAAKERERLADHTHAFAAAGITVIVPATRAPHKLLDHKDQSWPTGAPRSCRSHAGRPSRGAHPSSSLSMTSRPRARGCA